MGSCKPQAHGLSNNFLMLSIVGKNWPLPYFVSGEWGHWGDQLHAVWCQTFSVLFIYSTEIVPIALCWGCQDKYGEPFSLEIHHMVKSAHENKWLYSISGEMDQAQTWEVLPLFTDKRKKSQRCQLNPILRDQLRCSWGNSRAGKLDKGKGKGTGTHS